MEQTITTCKTDSAGQASTEANCTAALHEDTIPSMRPPAAQEPNRNIAADPKKDDPERKKDPSLEFPHNVWVQFGGVSYHFDRSQHFNEKNFGIGLEYKLSKDWALTAGQYDNSIRNTSHYAAVEWTPLHAGPVNLGVAGGAIDGYYFNHGGFFPMLLPMATVETKHFGVNAIYVPKMKDISSVVGLQFKARF